MIKANMQTIDLSYFLFLIDTNLKQFENPNNNYGIM